MSYFEVIMLENSIDKGRCFIGKGDNSVLEDLV
jgi:hypothetical protein